MAIDEALLESAVESGYLAFRWYRWDKPTISLGYFQDTGPEHIPEALESCPVVRRLTGGGAILHDREWTYSCVVPAGHPLLANSPLELYHTVHRVIAETFNRLGVPVQPRGESLTFPAGEPFLCYARGDSRDLLLAGHKIVGSAQRRRRGAVLQHGSLLLESSQHAPQFPGLLDLHSFEIDIDQTIDQITWGVARELSNHSMVCELPAEIREMSDRLFEERYVADRWNRKR